MHSVSPGRLLHTLPTRFGVDGRVGMARLQGDAICIAESSDKLRIPVRRLPTQMMMKVDCTEGEMVLLAQRPQAVQQRHGVGAAGDRTVDRAGDIPLCEKGCNAIPHCASIPGPRRW